VLEQWLSRLLVDHADSILPIDRAISEEWGRLSAVRTGSVVDLLMAATARVHGLTLVTRNIRDVAWTGVACLNPFEE
jgi:predicted nucleic acid-binding protein